MSSLVCGERRNVNTSDLDQSAHGVFSWTLTPSTMPPPPPRMCRERVLQERQETFLLLPSLPMLAKPSGQRHLPSRSIRGRD
ncbi:hypothetical protein HJFPF1_01587 [Paramyrothecium foliicola]|nr:hypothetical protein HJFPF1_01587 [Paramyrothecium foliicola]